VSFKPLELLEGTDVGICVIQRKDKSDCDQRSRLIQVVEKRSSIGVFVLEYTKPLLAYYFEIKKIFFDS
jgi:hypothetical protein